MKLVTYFLNSLTGTAKELYNSYTPEQREIAAHAVQSVAQTRAKYIFVGQPLPPHKASAIKAIEANLASIGITDGAAAIESLLPFMAGFGDIYKPLDPAWTPNEADLKAGGNSNWSRPEDATAEAIAARVKTAKPKKASKAKPTETEE